MIRICKCGKICYSEEDFQDHLEEDNCMYGFLELMLKSHYKFYQKLIQQKRKLLKLKNIDASKIPDDKLDNFVMLTCIIDKPTLEDIQFKIIIRCFFEHEMGYEPFKSVLNKITFCKN